jgi:hypothetical protein
MLPRCKYVAVGVFTYRLINRRGKTVSHSRNSCMIRSQTQKKSAPHPKHMSD